VDFTSAIYHISIFSQKLVINGLSLVLLVVFATSALANDKRGGYQYNNGYGHHDNHSGQYDYQRKHTEWRGPHKGCRIKGRHNHKDHQPEALSCLDAYAAPDALWPANHKFKTVTIEGLSTLRGEAPEVTVQCVTQDEPLNGQGDGNTDYDAQLVSGDTVKLRKERAGGGNGRVYSIDFIASDTVSGESCTGSVTVEVPHHKYGKAQDDGRLFSSVEGLDCVGANTNTAPEITSVGITTGTETFAYSYAVIATDSDGDALGYQLQSSPNGMTINSDGVIEWTPAEGQAGSHDVTVIVNDGNGGSAQQVFAVVVGMRINNRPVISSTPLLQGIEGQAYLYPVIAVDADGDALLYTLLNAPASMTINNEGLIQWTPQVGSATDYLITLQVTDTQNASVEQSYPLTIAPKPNTAPSISSVPLLAAIEDTLYQYSVIATDPDGDPLSYTLITAPTSMYINGSLVTWMPGYTNAGEHTVTIEVSDEEGGVASQSFTITVIDTNRDPEVISTPLLETAEGLLYEYMVIATDPDGDALQYALLDAPTGLTISDKGLLNWLPGYDDEGQYYISLEITDAKGGSSNQSFTLTVAGTNRDPMILSVPVITAQENTLYEYVFQAGDDDGDSLIYSLISAPQGMSVSTGGLVSWLPDFDSAGDYTIDIGASDGETAISQQFILTVANSNQLPVFQYSPDLTAQENVYYSMTVSATDSDGDTLMYSLRSAPIGMTINPLNGEINWLPDFNQAGGQSVSIQVDDGQGASISDSFIINVLNTNRLPVVDSTSVSTNEDTSAIITLSASDADTGTQLIFNVVTQPARGTLSGLAPTLEYTPATNFAGTDSFTIEVSDNNGGIVKAAILITVTGVNDTPAFNGAALNRATSGDFYNYLPSVTDPDTDDTLIYSVTTPPAGLSVNSLSGELTWIPSNSQVGSQSFALIVTDTSGAEASLIFNVIVEQGNLEPVVNSLPFTAAVVDNAYRYQINVSDPEQDTLTFSLDDTSPTGLTLNNQGLLSWMPTLNQVGTHPIAVVINDGQNTIRHSFDIKVVEVPVSIPSNMGRDFWLLDDENTEQTLIFVTSPVAASGLIEFHTIVTGRQTLYPFSLAAGEVIAFDLYQSQNYHSNDQVIQQSIHVTADNDVAVYGLYTANASSDAVTAFPAHTLGTEYLVLSYAEGEFSTSKSQLHVIATEDNTTVQLTPRDSAGLKGSSQIEPGQTITRILSKGDAYSLIDFDRDSTGTEIIADKPVAVFAKVKDGFVPIDSWPADRMIEQMPPVNLWGTSYATAPLRTRNSDFYRILAAIDDTMISLNGVPTKQLDRGEHYEIETGQAMIIEANHPILVAQYSASDSHDGDQVSSDPYYYLPKRNKSYEWDFTRDIPNYTAVNEVFIDPAPAANYVIIMMPPSGIGSLTVDGEAVPENSFETNKDIVNGYYMAQIALSAGEHTLSANEPFGVYKNVNRMFPYADPFMAVVPSTQQYLDHYIFTTAPNNFARHFINITIEISALSPIILDGKVIDPNYFQPIIGTNFVYAQLAVNVGSHEITADSPFGLLVYGFDNADSYGYVGGFSAPSTLAPESIGVSVDSAAQAVGNQNCINIQASGATGEPHSAVTVELQLTGAHPQTTRIFTNKLGSASYCYSGYQVGEDIVTVTAADISVTATVSWIAAIAPVAPVITSVPTTYVLAGNDYKYQVEAQDPNDDELSFSLTTAPEGMSIDTLSGLITWPSSVSSYTVVTVLVTDDSGLTAQQAYQLRANSAPRFEYYPPTEVWLTRNQSSINYRTVFRIVDDEDDRIYAQSTKYSVDPYAFHAYLTNLTPGNYSMPLSFEDEHGEIFYFDWQFTVYKNYSPQLVETQTEHIIKEGERFVWDFDYSDVNEDPNSFRINRVDRVSDSGSYSNPATIDDNGIFAWVPLDAGVWRMSIVVSDSFGDSDSIWITITVLENPLRYQSPPLQTGVGRILEYQLDTRALNRETAEYNMIKKSEGVIIDENGLLRWWPSASQEGKHVVTVEAVDDRGNIRIYTISINVANIDEEPFITTHPITQARTEDDYSYQLEASDPQGDPLQWRLGSDVPAAMTITSNGLLEWGIAETDIGEYPVAIEVEDSSGNIATQQYLLTVTGPGSILWNRRQCSINPGS
jgi:hypothetical protein